jgi:hypothetical protein
MNMYRTILTIFTVSALFFSSCKAQIPSDWKKKAEDAIKTTTGKNVKVPLTEAEIIQGLKEALTVGSRNTGSIASRVDAYYKNPLVFIPFPSEAQYAADKLRQIGLGNKVDEFIMTLNRAAENAAKEAVPIFVDAVKGLTITDAKNILYGSNDAATSYLRSKTYQSLFNKFQPIINRALANNNTTKYWSDLTGTYNKIPGVKPVNTNLSNYATEKAIYGLFYYVAQEELKIRKDPAARITDILKRVFGG